MAKVSRISISENYKISAGHMKKIAEWRNPWKKGIRQPIAEKIVRPHSVDSIRNTGCSSIQSTAKRTRRGALMIYQFDFCSAAWGHYQQRTSASWLLKVQQYGRMSDKLRHEEQLSPRVPVNRLRHGQGTTKVRDFLQVVLMIIRRNKTK